MIDSHQFCRSFIQALLQRKDVAMKHIHTHLNPNTICWTVIVCSPTMHQHWQISADSISCIRPNVQLTGEQL